MRPWILVWVGYLLISGSYAQWTWSPESGWTNPQYTSKSSLHHLFEKAKKWHQDENYFEAVRLLTTLRQNYPPSRYSEDILYLQADCFYHLKRFSEAHQAYRAYFLEYPHTPHLNTIVEREYEMGIGILEAAQEGEGGESPLGSPEEGIEVLKTLIKIYPFSEFSDDAQYRIASYYFAVNQFEEAEEAYQTLLKEYLLSPWRTPAAFQIALSYKKRHRHTHYENKWLLKAKKEFEKFLEQYPEAQQVPEAQELLKETIDQLAQKLFETGDYYQRTGASQAALHYFELLERRYPESRFTSLARQRINELEEL
jgi:outer membrane assembly lipoprotein YfiO